MSLPTTPAVRSTVLHTARDELLEVVAGLRNDGYDMVIDLTAVDYVATRAEPICPKAWSASVSRWWYR